MDIYRKNPIPAIYTWLPFIRGFRTSLLADCPHDAALLAQFQKVAAGQACISSLEDTTQLIIKAEFPDNILHRTGDSDEVIEWVHHGWNLWDAEKILTDIEPCEAMDPRDVGIDSIFLKSLADPISCIPHLQKVSEIFSNGYSLTPQTISELEKYEKPIIAGIELEAMKQPSKQTTRKRASSKTNPQIPSTLRTEILRRDNYSCVFCGQDSLTIALEVDHIIPRSLINKLYLDTSLHIAPKNLCTTCFKCNRGKRDHLTTEDIAFYIEAFSDDTHPNHGIVCHLKTIGKLQTI